MGNIINLLNLYLAKSTDEILTLLDYDRHFNVLDETWGNALMEEVYNRTIPKLTVKDGTGDYTPIEELPKIKIKTNRGRKS